MSNNKIYIEEVKYKKKNEQCATYAACDFDDWSICLVVY